MFLSYFIFCFSIVYVQMWALIEIHFFVESYPSLWLIRDFSQNQVDKPPHI